MKKLSSIFAMIMLGLTLALTGCRSEDDIFADVAPVIEEIFEDEGEDVTCVDIYDIQQIDRNHYTAIAEIEYDDGEQELLDINRGPLLCKFPGQP
jgi:hypothetical protein